MSKIVFLFLTLVPYLFASLNMMHVYTVYITMIPAIIIFYLSDVIE